MKTIQQISFFSLIIAFVLSSCTMQKRVYNKGYHVEWNKSNRTANKQELNKDLRANRGEDVQREVELAEEIEIAQQAEDNSVRNQDIVLEASAENTPPSLPKKEKINLLSGLKVKTVDLDKIANAYIPSNFKKIVKKQARNAVPAKHAELSIIAVIGLACGILSIGLMLLAWFIATGPGLVLASILMGVLAIVLSAVGLSETNDGKRGRGFAVAGLALGITSLVIYLAIVFLILLFFATLF